MCLPVPVHIFVLVQQLLIFLRVIRESALIAIHALRKNKLRTFLSVLGITIGIFSIITVLAVVDSMERYLKNNINSLGSDVIFIQKWPWYEENYRWWKYMNRPVASESDYKQVSRNSRYASTTSMIISVNNRLLKYGTHNISNTTMVGVTFNWQYVRNFDIEKGRYFTELETGNGADVAIIGSDVALNLFGEGAEVVGRSFKVSGRPVSVIGVFKKEGQSLLDNSLDNLIVTPYLFAVGQTKKDAEQNNPTILVKARENVPLHFMEDELRGIMRNSRRLKPGTEDNFALNKTTLLSDGIGQLFSIMSIAGWFIGSFSILVGGFGIANIMFVSVRERTNEIGIQKSLGAKNYFILLEFLTESVTLCLFGGIVGLVSVFLITLAVNSLLGMEMVLSFGNIMVGVVISVVIGILSGFVPALMASLLNPVDAMRSK